MTDIGEETKAMDYYSRALILEPDSPELVTNIGWLLEVKGHLREAREHYMRAQELLLPHSHPQIDRNLKNVEVRIMQDQQGGTRERPSEPEQEL